MKTQFDIYSKSCPHCFKNMTKEYYYTKLKDHSKCHLSDYRTEYDKNLQKIWCIDINPYY